MFDTEDKPLFWLNDDSSLLGSFHIDDGMRINVTGSSLISDYSEGFLLYFNSFWYLTIC